VCLDVINQTWSPMFDLINIFDTFLPQLLLYPNPADPLNPEAASLMLKESQKYEQKVRDYVKKYAKGLGEEPKAEKIDEESPISPNEEDDSIDIEGDDLDEKISLSNVSELSETSDIALME